MCWFVVKAARAPPAEDSAMFASPLRAHTCRAMTPQPSRHAITVTNITQNETFVYSLPIIKGYISSYSLPSAPKSHEITLRRLDDDLCTRWPVVNGNFKCLAELEDGVNELQLEFEDAVLQLNLKRRHLASPYHVLPVYIICCDHDGHFQGPDGVDCSPSSARLRIALGSRLIQSVTAEKLHEMELGRRSFRLASDLDPTLDCIIFRSQHSSSRVYDMAPEDIWELFGRELVSSQYGRDDRKFLAFLSCTRYLGDATEPTTHEEIVSKVRGHVALGGGGLAIFGTGCLHTWPETVQDVIPRFVDDAKIDRCRFMDDSCYRGTLGGCFSTTLGAVCHELGHAFDLGHSRKGIMGRGFDNIRLVFTVGGQSGDSNRNVITRSDAQHATVAFTRDINVTVTVAASPRKRDVNDERLIHVPETGITQPRGPALPTRTIQFGNKALVDDLTFWDKSCAVMLRFHKWFADPELDSQDGPEGTIEFDIERRTVTSPSGIRVVEMRGEDGLVKASWEFLSTWVPRQFVLPNQSQDLHDVTMLVAEDSCGNIIKEPIFTG